MKHALMSASVAWGTESMSTPPSSTVLRVTMSMKPSSRYVMFSLQVVVYLGVCSLDIKIYLLYIYFILSPAEISLPSCSWLPALAQVRVPLHCSSRSSTSAVWWVDTSMCSTVVPLCASCNTSTY